MATGTRTGSGSGIGTVIGIVVVIILAVAVVTAVRDQEDSTDTSLPPDPFESNEPRVIDCVGRWDNRAGARANFYCAVHTGPGPEYAESIDDYWDEDGIERSPFTWSTTAQAGNAVYMDMEVQGAHRHQEGSCEVWVDGDTLLGSDELFEDPEGVWFCRVEAVVP